MNIFIYDQNIDLSLFINQDFIHPKSKKNKYICSKEEKKLVFQKITQISL